MIETGSSVQSFRQGRLRQAETSSNDEDVEEVHGEVPASDGSNNNQPDLESSINDENSVEGNEAVDNLGGNEAMHNLDSDSHGDANSDAEEGSDFSHDEHEERQPDDNDSEDGNRDERNDDLNDSNETYWSQESNQSQESSEFSESGESGESEEEEEEEDRDNRPIFNGARITFKESVLAILTFILSHKLTGLCLADLLSLLSLHCGPNNILLKSLYSFKKYFHMIGKNFVKLHYYCSNCEVLLPGKNAACCGNRQVDTYFIEFPIINQLENLFARPGFYEQLQYRFHRVKKNASHVEEIYDGAIYQQLFNAGFLNNPNNISFFMYFDGVQIFRSSNFNIWPAYLTINELKYTLRTRKENTVLAGIWFGKSKPNPNLFLRPIHDFLISFETNGANLRLSNGNVINVKGKLLGAVADLPAKALFMRFIQYNGAFSCFNCMAEGGRYGVGENSTIQVFPYSRHLELRNTRETLDFAEQAIAARQLTPDSNVYGVKGPSLLSSLLPNFILCMGIDFMHGIFLGLTRTLLTLWFDPQHSNEPFSVSNLAHLVDARLKRIKPPSSFQSVPRSIKDLAKWKAFDLKSFFFYYSSVVLLGVLPERYWFHHVQLVTAISLLSQEGIAPEDFESVETMLHSYVSDFQELYGVRYMTLTIHQLLHVTLVCKNLGPAWVFSCFFYESLNGELVRLVHGSRHAALQICSSSAVFMKLCIMINNMPEGEAKTLCLRMYKRFEDKAKVTERIDFETGVAGKLKTCFPVPERISTLLRETFNIVGGRYKYFYKLVRRRLVYSSEQYLRSQEKHSYYVEIFYDGVPSLCKVISFIRWTSCDNNCTLDCNECPKRYFCIVKLYDRLMWEMHNVPMNNVMPHLFKVSPKDGIHAFPVTSIKSLCLFMCVDDNHYFSLPINNLEVE